MNGHLYNPRFNNNNNSNSPYYNQNSSRGFGFGFGGGYTSQQNPNGGWGNQYASQRGTGSQQGFSQRGVQQGYRPGANQGYPQGYNTGMNQGVHQGYNQGYPQGNPYQGFGMGQQSQSNNNSPHGRPGQYQTRPGLFGQNSQQNQQGVFQNSQPRQFAPGQGHSANSNRPGQSGQPLQGQMNQNQMNPNQMNPNQMNQNQMNSSQHGQGQQGQHNTNANPPPPQPAPLPPGVKIEPLSPELAARFGIPYQSQGQSQSQEGQGHNLGPGQGQEAQKAVEPLQPPLFPGPSSPIPLSTPGPEQPLPDFYHNLEEIIQNEKNAIVFYNHLAELAQDGHSKSFLDDVSLYCHKNIDKLRGLYNRGAGRDFNGEDRNINTQVDYRAGIRLALSEESRAMHRLADLYDDAPNEEAAKTINSLMCRKNGLLAGLMAI